MIEDQLISMFIQDHLISNKSVQLRLFLDLLTMMLPPQTPLKIAADIPNRHFMIEL
jgi:hypothetical protein